MNNFKIKSMLIGLMLMAGNLYGQTFAVGEKLPEEFFNTVHPAINLTTGEESTITLADYKDKLIILYYWFNGCKPCYRSFNKCDSIQPLLKGSDYVIIPFTYQTVEETRPTLRKFQWNLTSIVADSTLFASFTSSTFRNMAWIKGGRVFATPDTKYLTAENIVKVLENRHHPFPLRVDRTPSAVNKSSN